MTAGGRDPRLELVADCGSCAGLCCEAPAFAKSADFAIDKPARTPCPHLGLPVGPAENVNWGCTIHTELPERGFPGCVVYDCFGAGQRVVQVRYAGADPADPVVRRGMLDAFELVERLHEVQWYLADATARDLLRDLADEVAGLSGRISAIADLPSLTEADVVAVQQRASGLLGEVSAHLRRGLDGLDLQHADLAGQDLRGCDLHGARLRGAVLIGADLRDQDLGPVDLLGADLRAADLRGADLREAFCLTRLQVRAARTDGALLPASWDRP